MAAQDLEDGDGTDLGQFRTVVLRGGQQLQIDVVGQHHHAEVGAEVFGFELGDFDESVELGLGAFEFRGSFTAAGGQVVVEVKFALAPGAHGGDDAAIRA